MTTDSEELKSRVEKYIGIEDIEFTILKMEESLKNVRDNLRNTAK